MRSPDKELVGAINGKIDRIRRALLRTPKSRLKTWNDPYSRTAVAVVVNDSGGEVARESVGETVGAWLGLENAIAASKLSSIILLEDGLRAVREAIAAEKRKARRVKSLRYARAAKRLSQ